MKTRLLSMLLAAMTAALAHAAEQPIYPSLKGDLVSVQGKSVKKFDEATLASVKYYGIYYSAHWCGPCRAFTPRLVDFYKKTKPAHPEFEVIFVSSDHDEKSMEAYMEEAGMPWPALGFRKKNGNKALTGYGGRGIPCLVFVDASGKVLSHSYEGAQYVGPSKVMADIEKTLGTETAPAATGATTGSVQAPGGGLGVSTGSAQRQAPASRSSTFDEFFKKKTPAQP